MAEIFLTGFITRNIKIHDLPLPVLEEAWIQVQPWFPPLYVEVEREGYAEVAIVDFEDVGNVDLDQDLVWLVCDKKGE